MYGYIMLAFLKENAWRHCFKAKEEWGRGGDEERSRRKEESAGVRGRPPPPPPSLTTLRQDTGIYWPKIHFPFLLQFMFLTAFFLHRYAPPDLVLVPRMLDISNSFGILVCPQTKRYKLLFDLGEIAKGTIEEKQKENLKSTHTYTRASFHKVRKRLNPMKWTATDNYATEHRYWEKKEWDQ